jgi:hypothetical protein
LFKECFGRLDYECRLFIKMPGESPASLIFIILKFYMHLSMLNPGCLSENE